MAKARRLFWEVLILLILAGGVFVAWRWSQIETQRALGEQLQRHQGQMATLRHNCEAWGERLSDSQAIAAFRAFAAGIHPTVLAGRREALDQSLGSILQLPGVAFVHILDPSGRVLASSNQKFLTTGQVGERAAWALAAEELVTRAGELEGTLEVAAPVQGASGPVAVLWLAYDTRSLKAETREQVFGLGAEPLAGPSS